MELIGNQMLETFTDRADSSTSPVCGLARWAIAPAIADAESKVIHYMPDDRWRHGLCGEGRGTEGTVTSSVREFTCPACHDKLAKIADEFTTIRRGGA